MCIRDRSTSNTTIPSPVSTPKLQPENCEAHSATCFISELPRFSQSRKVGVFLLLLKGITFKPFNTKLLIADVYKRQA